VRAFLAIPVLPPAVADYEALRKRLGAAVDAVRWAPAESPHITLHFFGSISTDASETAMAALRGAVASRAVMTLRLQGLGAFPSSRRPRVLWWGVDGEVERLAELAHLCAGTLSAAGFPVDERPYRPHCTLGRPREPWPARSLERWREAAATGPSTAAFAADRIILYESVADGAALRHVPRSVMPLR
jgi:2'-5' RNA ligase